MQTYFNLMGFEFVADVDWTLTYRGCPAKLYGPPENCYPAEDPEWEINSITLHLDNGGNNLGPGFEATGALFELLASSREVDDAILEHIFEYGEDEGSYMDEDYYRDER